MIRYFYTFNHGRKWSILVNETKICHSLEKSKIKKWLITWRCHQWTHTCSKHVLYLSNILTRTIHYFSSLLFINLVMVSLRLLWKESFHVSNGLMKINTNISVGKVQQYFMSMSAFFIFVTTFCKWQFHLLYELKSEPGWICTFISHLPSLCMYIIHPTLWISSFKFIYPTWLNSKLSDFIFFSFVFTSVKFKVVGWRSNWLFNDIFHSDIPIIKLIFW